jgi:hypothetical protein
MEPRPFKAPPAVPVPDPDHKTPSDPADTDPWAGMSSETSSSWQPRYNKGYGKGKGKSYGKSTGKDGKLSKGEMIAQKRQLAKEVHERHEAEGYRNHPHYDPPPTSYYDLRREIPPTESDEEAAAERDRQRQARKAKRISEYGPVAADRVIALGGVKAKRTRQQVMYCPIWPREVLEDPTRKTMGQICHS